MTLISRTVSLAGLAAFVITGSLVANASAPLRYNAISDNMPRPEPPAPQLGPAGYKFQDPTFGTTLLRVTDENTNPDAIGGGFLTPGGSFEVNWNADTTMFWVWTVGGFMMPFHFDAATFTATPVRDLNDPSRILTLPYEGSFSFRRPNIMYATAGMNILEYDFNTQTSKTVFAGNDAVPSASGYGYVPSASDDDSRLCLAFGGAQDTYPYVAVLDRNTGRYQVLDTVNSRLNGQPTNNPLGYGIHSAYIDRSGRYVIIAKGAGKPEGTEWTVWDVDAGRVYDIQAEWSGHDAAGFGVRVNQSGFYGGDPVFYDEQEWAIRGLGENEINNYQYLIPWQNLPTPHDGICSGHHSWNNARPDVLVPVIGSIVRDANASSVAWRPWDDEIIGVATDGSGTVYRFAHHHSVWDRSDFWDDPHGNVSQDGRWYIFTSNWGRTLGEGRHDVFIVKLDAGSTPPPQPVDTAGPAVKITAPTDGATVNGPVTITASASDDSGVAGVQFLINGQAVGAEDTAAPYQYNWSPTNGSYTITARARDANGNVTTSTPVSVTVELPPPPDRTDLTPVSESIVNGAGFKPGPLAPGSIVSVFGRNLSAAVLSASDLPLPRSLGGMHVAIDGADSPLFYVSPLQVNLQIPWEAAGRSTARLDISVPGAGEASQTINLAPFAPGIFTVPSPAGQGAILIANTGTVAAPEGSIPGAHPARRGDYISIYCTGLGAVTNQPETGKAGPGAPNLARTLEQPSVTIGGQPAEVTYSGLAPGYVGLYQVDARVPESVAGGNAVPVVLTIGGAVSNMVTIAVAPADPGTPLILPTTGTNLLANPGFEQGTANWAFFDHERRWLVSDNVHSGSYAAKVGAAVTFYSTVEQIVPVQGGKAYRAAAWMQLEGIDNDRGAGIVLFWRDANNTVIGETYVSCLKGTFPWRYIEGTVVAPASAEKVQFELWAFSEPDDTGTAWFDDAWFGPAN